MKKIIICIVVLAGSLLNLATAQQAIPAVSAKDYIGQTITVEGVVDQVHKTDKAIYFNMGGAFPNHVFAAVIFATSFANFKKVGKYEGKYVEITGEVQDYKGKPEIVLNNEDQIRIVKKK